MQTTRLRGARTNNLQNVDLNIDPGSFVVIAGPSGAGKSSLVFGTLYAEGQRRYVESFSAYARQFLERLARPPVDQLEPVPAGIAVDRQPPAKTSRSTVGTITEIADYAKVLWAECAQLICPGCQQPVRDEAPIEAAQRVIDRLEGQKVVVTYPLSVQNEEHFLLVREKLIADGYRRIQWDESVRDLDEIKPSEVMGRAFQAQTEVRASSKTKKKSRRYPTPDETTHAVVHVIADRTIANASQRSRLVEALEAAMARGDQRAQVRAENGTTLRFSAGLHCAECDRNFSRPTPAKFSFNSPIGACDACRGFGRTITIDWDRVIPKPSLSLEEGAIRPWQGKGTTWERRELKKQCARLQIPMNVPFDELTDAQRALVIDGEGKGWSRGYWWGVRAWFQWLETKAYKMHVRVLLSRYRKYETCVACSGSRLKPEVSWWKVGGLSIAEFFALPVSLSIEHLEQRETLLCSDPASALVVRECLTRLRTLKDVGLGYLSLDRQTRTLSGGEAQRVALTSALGASFAGAMFVLEEPTSGLHPADVERLLTVIERLASRENIVIVVEHDFDVIRRANRVVELGPGAGEHGGHIVFDGDPRALLSKNTATATAMRSNTHVSNTRRPKTKWIRLLGATGNNLKNVDLEIPLGAFTCVTGVSGSGKSSLILETLWPAVDRALGGASDPPLSYQRIEGTEWLRGVLRVDQSSLGRTSRGNPATYMHIWDIVRRRFADEVLAKEREYGPGMFSFNVPGGRCEACKGEGSETVEMQFLADVTFSCPECGGQRFTGPVLDVRHRGKSINELLTVTAQEATELWKDDLELTARVRPLLDVGLGYVRLGQPLSTLSGGEAQRLKLAEALARAMPGSLVILDEPTAGLHAQDIEPLMNALNAMVDRGDTVVVVEHEMRVIARADHVIDLGPGAGEEGGRVIAKGTPEEVAACESSATAPFIASELGDAEEKSRVASQNGFVEDPADDIRANDIEVRGAREHNLKDISIAIPRNKLVVVTGPSGSGKTTLAFDVLFAEGQRRYLETLSPYARQYLPQLPRPNVDRVAGLPPSVSLEQRITRGGANSTVATVTEVAHFLRLLYARAGLLHCPRCRVPIAPREPQEIVRDLEQRFGRAMEFMALSPIVRGRKGIHREVLDRVRRQGFEDVRIDGEWKKLEPGLKLARFREHDIDLVMGRFRASDPNASDLLQQAMERGRGAAKIVASTEEILVSKERACPSCGTGFPELDPRLFSFNTRQGACEACEGRGSIIVEVGRGKNAREVAELCNGCEGTRLSSLARAVSFQGRAIFEFLQLDVSSARVEFSALTLKGRDAIVAGPLLQEMDRRLVFLETVGLGYLGLDRAADTLSGGEMQRVRLASQLGNGLTGVLYVLDEPTIGLHPRDTGQLLQSLRALVDRGNSVVVVEHDADTIRAADLIFDMGPSGGRHGGNVVASGTPSALLRKNDSPTGIALGKPFKLGETARVRADSKWIEVLGAKEHNLRDVHIKIPVGALVVVTGVSGSGKSTFARDVLLRAVRKTLGLVTEAPGKHDSVRGIENIQRAIEVDQSPIGRTPRSVPATYVGVWDEIRKLLAGTPEARARGYDASRFSFNVAAGRCSMCDGQGALTVEMAFLPEVMIPCEACEGKRFNSETLAVQWSGKNAAEILDLDINDAVKVFASVPKVRQPLALLAELGLGYLHLGQPSNTLSGGEAQRIKLVAELTNTQTARTLYVMDEPTTGLHRSDVERLLVVLNSLVERGDTVVVVEHNPDVIAAADWLIDLGPEGGRYGGTVVVEGEPREVMRCIQSHTGAMLRRELTNDASSVRKSVEKPIHGATARVN